MGIDLSATHESLRADGVQLWVRRDWLEALPVEAMLAGAPLESWGSPVPHALHGRAAVHVLETPRGQVVAKGLSRGGIIGALFRSLYADPERPAREALVAEQLAARGLPTPPIVAARALRVAPGLHRLELASARVAGARDLLDALRDPAADDRQRAGWAAAAGRTLRRLHDEGLQHRDLQVKNLLVGPGSAELLTVIDLDRCLLGPSLSEDQREASLARFGRSLAKRGLLPRRGERLSAEARQGVRAFLRAYGGPRRVERMAAVRRRLARSLAGHQWFWRGSAPGS